MNLRDIIQRLIAGVSSDEGGSVPQAASPPRQPLVVRIFGTEEQNPEWMTKIFDRFFGDDPGKALNDAAEKLKDAANELKRGDRKTDQPRDERGRWKRRSEPSTPDQPSGDRSGRQRGMDYIRHRVQRFRRRAQVMFGRARQGIGRRATRFRRRSTVAIGRVPGGRLAMRGIGGIGRAVGSMGRFAAGGAAAAGGVMGVAGMGLSVVGGVMVLAGAAIAAKAAIDLWANRLRESLRPLEQYSSALAAASAQADVGQIMRDFRRAQVVGESGARLIEARENVREAELPMKTLTTDLWNRAATWVSEKETQVIAGMTKFVAEFGGPLGDMLQKIIDELEKQNADDKEAMGDNIFNHILSDSFADPLAPPPRPPLPTI